MYMAAVHTKKKSGKALLIHMRKALSAKRCLLARLQDEHDQLQHQQDLLLSFCDTFDWMRQHQLSSLLPDAVLQSAFSSSNSLATEEELGLLQQLQPLQETSSDNGTMPSNSNSAAGSRSGSAAYSAEAFGHGMDAATAPLSPQEDPLWMMRHLLSQPPIPELHTINLEQLQELHKSSMREMSVQLMHLGLLGGQQLVAPAYSSGQADQGQARLPRPADLQRLQQLVCSYFKLVLELVVSRPVLVAQLQLSNVETGEMAAEPDKQRHRLVLQQLGLTQQQQERIARNLALYKRLLSPVLQELKELQLQQAAGCAAAGVSGGLDRSDGAAAVAGSASAGVDVDSQQLPAMPAAGAADCSAAVGASCEMPRTYIKGAQLEVQQQRSSRMKMLLRKDVLMRTFFAGCAYGCLSYVQLALLNVLMYPSYPTPFVFFTEVAEHLAQQEALPYRTQQQLKCKLVLG